MRIIDSITNGQRGEGTTYGHGYPENSWVTQVRMPEQPNWKTPSDVISDPVPAKKRKTAQPGNQAGPFCVLALSQGLSVHSWFLGLLLPESESPSPGKGCGALNSRIKIPQKATNRAASNGPITNPFIPNSTKPPRVERRTI